MSTRCNILVENYGRMTQYYHHCDGYPEGVGYMCCLADNMASLSSSYEYDKEYDRVYKSDELEENFKKFLEMTDKGRFEKEPLGLHGDIEYLYYVTIRDCGIKVTYCEVEFFWHKKGHNQEEITEAARTGKVLNLDIRK